MHLGKFVCYTFYMEQVGYIEKGVSPLVMGLNSVEKLMDTQIKFADRDLVESRDDVVQPICAGVMITQDNKVLTIRKHAKATGVSSPEKDKTLLYLGGHLDVLDNSLNNLESFKIGMKREVEEETGFRIDNTCILKPIVTYTPTTLKSSKHFGVIFPVIIPKAFDLTFSDGVCSFVDVESLDAVDNLDSWSEIILREVIQKNKSLKNVIQL